MGGVMRVNYIVHPLERVVGTTPSIPARLRAPLLALMAVSMIVVTLSAVQMVRLGSVQHRGAELRTLQRLAQTRVDRLQTLQHEVDLLRRNAKAVGTIRRSGAVRADELARLGNGVPAGAWISAVRLQQRDVAIEGRGTGLREIGATMASLGRLPGFHAARLLDVRRTAERDAVTYTIGLERTP